MALNKLKNRPKRVDITMSNNLNVKQQPKREKDLPMGASFIEQIRNEWQNDKELHQGNSWLTDLRAQSFETFLAQGLPTEQLERWKYTPLMQSLKNIPLRYSKTDVTYDDPYQLVQPLKEVFLDAPTWFIDVQSLSPAGENKYLDMSLWHLANAFNRDGLLIHTQENQSYSDPINIYINGHDKSFIIPRTFFKVEKGSDITIVEYHQGKGNYWNNRLTQIILEPHSHLRHIRIQNNSETSLYTQNTHVQMHEGSEYEAFTLTLGSALSRNQVHTELLGRNAKCKLYGVNLLNKHQIADTTITIDHIAPECQSDQFYRSVLDDASRGIYQGKVYVDKNAQKTDGYQLSNAILLNEGAEMNAKPELEIYADDVKCSHGATSGMIDDEQLFYLRSRGIPEEDAKSLLIKAFVSSVVEKISDENIQAQLSEQIDLWLRTLK